MHKKEGKKGVNQWREGNEGNGEGDGRSLSL